MSIPTLEIQFENIIQPRIDRLNETVGRQVADVFEEKMKQNTLSGRGFGNDEYDSSYSQSHRSERRRQGLQTSRVTLRMKNRRIENTIVETTGGKSGQTTIRHAEMGDIFKMHHTGRAMGGKVRSIWPKTPESIPQPVKNRVKELIAEGLRGQK